MNKYIDDIFYLFGAVLVTGYAYSIKPALALLVAGLFCLHFSYLIGKAAKT